MYFLTSFHNEYPDAQVIIAGCGDTIKFSCIAETENNSSLTV